MGEYKAVMEEVQENNSINSEFFKAQLQPARQSFFKYKPGSNRARREARSDIGGDSAYYSSYSVQKQSQTKNDESIKLLELTESPKHKPKKALGRTKDGAHSYRSTVDRVETKAQSLANLSETLYFLDQCKRCQEEKELLGQRNVLVCNDQEPHQTHDLKEKEFSTTDSCDQHQDKDFNEGICVAVSLRDGLVLHTTDFLTNVLGYPKDMWVGRSFLDFIHIEDRESFSKYVTDSLDMEYTGRQAYIKPSMFARIRIYKGLREGYSVKGRRTLYTPFKMSVYFRGGIPTTDGTMPNRSCLFITAVPIASAYNAPLEKGPVWVTAAQNTFSTRQRADCTLTWIDDWMISYTGYVPQHLIGHNLLEFIHPKDMVKLKDVIMQMVKQKGKPRKSEGMRMKIKNGSYITINSTWDCFFNPWTQNLEFVTGTHTVHTGPENAEDFFNETLDPEAIQGLSITGESIQNEIKKSLTKTLQLPSEDEFIARTPSMLAKKRKKEAVENFMGCLLEVARKSLTISSATKYLVPVPPKIPVSSDTDSPPNYDQLNYKENMTRYFKSQPRTYKNASGSKESFFSQEEETNENETNKIQQSGQRKRKIGSQGSGSGKRGQSDFTSSSPPCGLSMGQQGANNTMYKHDVSGDDQRLSNKESEQYKAPFLTEELMALHNKDMETMMKVQFKEAKKMAGTDQPAQQRQVSQKSMAPLSSNTDRKKALPTKSDKLLVYPGMPGQQPRSIDINRQRLPEDSDSSDLYSYLHTSSDMITLLSSAEDSRKAKATQKILPVLPKPFWNQQVTVNEELNFQYEIPHVELEEVLKRDQEKLEKMNQPNDLDCQLAELSDEVGEEVDMEDFLEDLQCAPSGDESAENAKGTSVEEILKQRNKTIRRKYYQDNMSMFMGADAPFPELSPQLRALGLNSSMNMKKFKSNAEMQWSTSSGGSFEEEGRSQTCISVL